MEIKRGDIWYVSRTTTPAVSRRLDARNHRLQREEQRLCRDGRGRIPDHPTEERPATHVLIRSSERESTALCEQITTVSVDRLLGYKGHLTPAEMTNVEVAMLISLELEVGKPVEKIVEVTKEVPVIRDVKVSTPASNPNMAAELAAAKAKCEMLQTMYESLLNRVLAGKAG